MNCAALSVRGPTDLKADQPRIRQTPGSHRRIAPLISRISLLGACALVLLVSVGLPAHAAPHQDQEEIAEHTNPLNLDPAVRDAYKHLYNLDYDGAITRFDAVVKAHPQDPMAYGYLDMATTFRELYHQDLLDTTYYAHDSFLTNKRQVDISPATREHIESLTNTGIQLADEQIKADPNDKDAWFARGYIRGIHAVLVTLVDNSFGSAARQGLAARNDSEQVLKLDPEYVDAKMAIGIQQFAAGSLPRFVRIMVGIFGIGGNKQRGLQLLRDAGAHGTVTSVESRTVLSLFLRHDGHYAEALAVQRTLADQYPHNYIFRLEVANLTKDEGNGPAAIALYKQVLADAPRSHYFTEPRLQLAYFGLAETQRGQNDIADAAENYVKAANQPDCSDWMRKRAQLNAGEMYDLLHDREKALQFYKQASAPGGDQSQADTARKLMQHPYTGK